MSPNSSDVTLSDTHVPTHHTAMSSNQSAFSNALPATLDELMSTNHNASVDQAERNRQLELNRIRQEEHNKQLELNRIRQLEQNKQAELNKLKQIEGNRLSNLYKGSNHVVYHIVVDSVCSLNLRAIKPYTHGNMRAFNKQAGRIPVTLDLNDAEEIAAKIVREIDNRGSSSTNAYPIFGAIILKIELANLPSHYADVYRGGAKRDYGLLQEHMNNENQLVVYNAGGKNRGMLHPNAMENAKLSEIKYVIAFRNVDEHMGFAMLNSLKLDYHDIYQMKKAYKAGLNGQSHVLDEIQSVHKPYAPQEQPMSNIVAEPVVESFPQVLAGGSQIDYKQLYLEEKATYLKLKAIKDRQTKNRL
jgi:hypothetical protein